MVEFLPSKQIVVGSIPTGRFLMLNGGIMTYAELKVFFEMFRLEQISKRELAAAICMWQRAGAMI